MAVMPITVSANTEGIQYRIGATRDDGSQFTAAELAGATFTGRFWFADTLRVRLEAQAGDVQIPIDRRRIARYAAGQSFIVGTEEMEIQSVDYENSSIEVSRPLPALHERGARARVLISQSAGAFSWSSLNGSIMYTAELSQTINPGNYRFEIQIDAPMSSAVCSQQTLGDFYMLSVRSIGGGMP